MTRADSPVSTIDRVLDGATVAQQVWPNSVDRNAVELLLASRGLSKLEWLSALKNSDRSSTFTRSVTRNSLDAARSMFQNGTARNRLRPDPSRPGAGIAKLLPSPTKYEGPI